MLLKKLIDAGDLTGKLKHIEADTCLFESGETNEALYYLISGSAKLMKSSGTEQTVETGTLLGLTDLMRPVYTCTVVTLEPSEVLVIAKEELQRALQLNAELRLYLIQQLSRSNTLASTSFE